MNHDEQLTFWNKHINACEKSNSKITVYCKEHNLVESRYYAYRKKLRSTPAIHFLEVMQDEGLYVEFQLNGNTIKISKEHLPYFMEVLRD